MSNLQHRQTKIQEKRKQTPWRDFVMEICSWSPNTYYKRHNLVSIYPESDRLEQVVSVGDFEEKRNNNYIGTLYDSSFFKNISILQKNIAIPCVRQYGSFHNGEYSDTNANVENCFLTRCSTTCINTLYSLVVKKTQNVINCIKVQGGEGNIYNSTSIDDSFNIFYSKCIEQSANIWFSSNLVGCSECLFCDNLQNISYAVGNIAYSEIEYYKKKDELLSQKHMFDRRFHELESANFKTIKSINVENVYGGTHVINGRNNFIVGNPVGTSNIYDVICTGTLGDYYGCTDSGVNSENIYCSVAIVSSHTIFYSQFLESCSFCLGCIGLKNKSYCILNKQYTKEEWYQKVDEIFTQMEADGTLGQFFPATMNPFYFNDTAAYLIDPSFTKEEVTAKGYLWRDEPIKVDIPEGAEVVKTQDLGKYEGFDEQGSWIINKEILKKIIQDEQGNVYRIVSMEYDFLMKYGLTLPRKHWLDRMRENFRIT